MEKIMLTDVPVIWKMLLMLGIGIFKEFDDVTYLEIMKELANNQKLFMIIATSDYIYGTNYQFCHEYIGKDIIQKMTQEKAIQAFGRVGRQSAHRRRSLAPSSPVGRACLPEASHKRWRDTLGDRRSWLGLSLKLRLPVSRRLRSGPDAYEESRGVARALLSRLGHQRRAAVTRTGRRAAVESATRSSPR